MKSAELVQAGRLEEGLSALQQEIRDKPEDTRLRIFLFQLNCIFGRLDKALAQLQVIASLSADTMLLAQIFRPVITCEMLRRETFAGKRTPLIFGEPMEWVGLLVQANELVARGEFAAAASLRAKAFESAPASAGKIDGQPFEWIADGDSRLGPVVEAFVDSKYYWIPFSRIQKIEMEKPSDMRDLVWMPAQFTWTNGGAAPGHIPARYPDTEASTDDTLRLGRRTEWREQTGETFLGLGQRVWATDAGEFPLLSCRSIELS
ncbi:MAG TPA: type VI secretion system accessory protein TagJ [Verrucomicrobiae bacterium]|jgi:type VI secretion system protein ImpE|nr:type VI secretion system accessory protein TagJ [Verrucomicrobiae bacterium]